MNNVTVVIPVYGDWGTLQKCIESLKKYLPNGDRVLLVNDMGPDWEVMEKNIIEAIEGDSVNNKRFFYERNKENLGFVKTCNRAVLEIDKTDNDILLLNSDTEVTEGFLEELKEVLNLTEKHGAVCPRSNCATLLTVPIHNNTGREITFEESHSIYEKVKAMLPRYQVIPTGVGFCLLIKRSIIKELGLFDMVYGKGYNEENDFCMRINQVGYSIVMANKAYVYHYEGKSFGEAKKELDEKNFKTLVSRYPHYPYTVNRYFTKEEDPVDYFADQIASDVLYDKKRILISMYEVPAVFNGTAELAMEFIKYFYEEYREKFDINVYICKEADEFFGLSKKYPDLKVWDYYSIQGQSFYLGYSISQIFNMGHLLMLNQTCLKIVFNMQDIISVRCRNFLQNYEDRDEVFLRSIRYCDAMTAISKFTLVDTKAYFNKEFLKRRIPYKIVLDGTKERGENITETFAKEAGFELPFKDYFFVYGNQFPHKFLNPTLSFLENTGNHFVFLGAKEEGMLAQNIYGYKSGKLSEAFIQYLLENSDGIVFPSMYEGFGLPILEAMRVEKPIIARNTEVNRELKESFIEYANNIYLFDTLEDIPMLLEQLVDVAKGREIHCEKLRCWKSFADEVGDFLVEIVNAPVDTELLQERNDYCRTVETVMQIEQKNYATMPPKIEYVRVPVQEFVPYRVATKDFLKRRVPLIYRIGRAAKRIIKRR